MDEEIEETVGDLLDSIKTQIKTSGEDIEESLNHSTNKIFDYISELLNEIKKSNILYRKILQIQPANNPIKSKYLKNINKSVLIVHDSFNVAKDFAYAIAESQGKSLKILSSSIPADLVELTRVCQPGDYVFIDYSKLSSQQKIILFNWVKTNTLIMETDTKLGMIPLKKLNFIIYTDMLELVDCELVKELMIINNFE